MTDIRRRREYLNTEMCIGEGIPCEDTRKGQPCTSQKEKLIHTLELPSSRAVRKKRIYSVV
jgi:hypothetical protein